MNILCVTPWFPNTPTAGHYNYIYHSVNALKQAGHDVTVLVTRPWTPRVFRYINSDWDRKPLHKELFDPDINLNVCHYLSIPRYYCYELSGPLYSLGTAHHIRRLIKEHKIQLIHAHTDSVGYTTVPLAHEAGIPAVLTLHGINTAPRMLDTFLKRERVRTILANSDRVVLVGEPLREYFAALAGRDDHFRVVPNGFFFHDKCRTATRFQQNEPLRIVSVSNLHEGKGIDLNLQALAGLNESGSRHWHYTIVGGGRERDNLEAMVRGLGLTEQVKFRGLLQHDQVFDALTDADVFLLPSYREAFGIAYLEAMAAGLVAIGVQGQGPEAFIRDGETGYLVPPQDSQAITDLLSTIINDKNEAGRIADAGREHVRQNFTWERHAEKLTALYGEVLESCK
ncbi:MAG: glycosyltransferase [Desulfuromonadaceae bacterium]|nr:glycosyltransferase [Desulfuromonadaceae bacterium]